MIFLASNNSVIAEVWIFKIGWKALRQFFFSVCTQYVVMPCSYDLSFTSNPAISQLILEARQKLSPVFCWRKASCFSHVAWGKSNAKQILLLGYLFLNLNIGWQQFLLNSLLWWSDSKRGDLTLPPLSITVYSGNE